MDLLFILYDPLEYILNHQALKRTQMLYMPTNFSECLKDRTLRKYNFMNSFNVKTDFKHYKVFQGTTCVWKIFSKNLSCILSSDDQLRNKLFYKQQNLFVSQVAQAGLEPVWIRSMVNVQKFRTPKKKKNTLNLFSLLTSEAKGSNKFCLPLQNWLLPQLNYWYFPFQN